MGFAIDLGFYFDLNLDWLEDLGSLSIGGGLFVIFLVLIAAVIVLTVLSFLYLHTLKRTFEACSPENCEMNSPRLVWLNLIPIFGQYWIFATVIKLANSVKKEYAALGISRECSGGYAVGLAFPICYIVSFFPFIGYASLTPFTSILHVSSFVSVCGFVCWIIHWVQVGKFRRTIKQRKQPQMDPHHAAPAKHPSA